MTTDTSEKGLESLIVAWMTGETTPAPSADAHEKPAPYGGGWILGDAHDYDRESAVDLAQLSAFLRATQPDAADALDLDDDSPTRRKFLARLQGEISKRGVIDVLRHGVKHGPHQLDLFYGTPVARQRRPRRSGTPQNRFSVTRQLRYSRDETQLALDLGLFINGLPVATFELKNSLTKQTVADAVEQYKRDRDPREKLFEFGRCVVHFAVDDSEVRFCTHLKGKASWFLPFNQGWNDGAGNPPNPDGLKTDYLWKRILTREGLTDILENYAQVVEEKDREDRRKKPSRSSPATTSSTWCASSWPTPRRTASGRRYLIQHSAGSGKSNSIAWLAHQLIGLQRGTTRRSSTRSSSSPTGGSSTSRSATRSSSSPRWARPSATPSTPATCASSSRTARRSSSRRCRSSRSSSTRSATSSAGGASPSSSTRRTRARAARPRRRCRMALVGGRRRGGRRDLRGQDQPPDGGAQAAAQRELLRLHRHAQEQDARDLRRAVPQVDGVVKHRPVPQLHDEAGDPGGLHPRRAQGTTRRSRATTS